MRRSLRERCHQCIDWDLQSLRTKTEARIWLKAEKSKRVRDELDEATNEGAGRTSKIAMLSGRVTELWGQLERARAESEASVGSGIALVETQQEVCPRQRRPGCYSTCKFCPCTTKSLRGCGG